MSNSSLEQDKVITRSQITVTQAGNRTTFVKYEDIFTKEETKAFIAARSSERKDN